MRRRGHETLPQKVGKAIDSFIGLIAPERALRRRAARNALEVMGMGGAYDGAKEDRDTDDWEITRGSADADLSMEFELLRARSRQLNRNNGTASGTTNSIVRHSIGLGHMPQSLVDVELLGITEKEGEEWQRGCEAAWKCWIKQSDANGFNHFPDQEKLAQRQILECGEALAIPVMVADKHRDFELACELIEPDRLETPWSNVPEGKDVRHGVEVGDRKQPIAYYIREAHPGDIGFDSRAAELSYRRIPAVTKVGRPGLLHLYQQPRPGQSRGTPLFAPVLRRFHRYERYEEAEEVAARVAACFAGFVQRKSGFTNPLAPAKKKDSKRIEELEPGMIFYLEDGEEISFGNPTRPSNGFQMFMEHALRSIGAALGIPYEVIAKDFSKTNYSSARAALLEAWLLFEEQGDFLARRFCQPFWEMLIEEAWLKGRLPNVNFYANRAAWLSARWIGPGMQWVDPVKEVQAAELRMKNNLSTLADECAALGRDAETVLIQRARERKRMKELGITENTTPGVIQKDEPEEAPAKDERGNRDGSKAA